MRVLLVQLADIGDLVLTTPALSALREALPDAHLTLLTTRHSAPVVERAGLVDEIVTLEQSALNRATAFFKSANLKRIFALGQYDTVIYFHHFTIKAGTLKYALIGFVTRSKRRIGLDNGNGWFLTDRLRDGGFGAKHQAQYWLDLVGLLGADPRPRPAKITTANSTVDLGLPRPSPTVVIHPGGGGYSMARRWDAESFAKTADRLHEDCGAAIILVGTSDDNTAAVKAAMRHEPVDLTDKTGLTTLAAVIQDQADLFIGAESGVMHIAAAVETPVLAIFGPGNPDAWGPWNPGGSVTVLRSLPECSPCSYVGHGVGLREGCPARTCMRMVTVDQVVDAAKQMLDGQAVGERLASPAAAKSRFSKRIEILDLPVDAITYPEWLDLIDQWVRGEGIHHVCTINPEFIMIARHDPNFWNILSRADLCIPDGVGLLWASKHQGTPLPQRVTGSDGVPIIAERAAEKGWKIFFLGAAPGVADQAADILRVRFPDLKIVGTYSGSPAPEEEDALVERVNHSGADILFVAYGAPQQDKWIARNLPRLQVKMAMGVGGAFDFIAGAIPRAPLWMQRLGLEWLFRLYLQPWRIGRILRLPRFVLAVLLDGLR